MSVNRWAYVEGTLPRFDVDCNEYDYRDCKHPLAALGSMIFDDLYDYALTGNPDGELRFVWAGEEAWNLFQDIEKCPDKIAVGKNELCIYANKRHMKIRLNNLPDFKEFG